MNSESDTKRQRLSDNLLHAACAGDIDGCRRAWVEMPNKEEFQKLREFYDGSYSSRWDIEESTSPLHMAVYHGHTSIVKLLVQEFGFPVNQIDYVETPLGVACHEGHVEICRVLLEELGANPNLGGAVHGECDDGAICPLWAAACNGSTEIVKLLIQHGARTDFNSDVICESARQGSPYDCAYPTEIALRNSNVEMLQVFSEQEADFPCDPDVEALQFRDCTGDMMEFLTTTLQEGKHKSITRYLSKIIGTLLSSVPDNRHEEMIEFSCFVDAGLQYEQIRGILSSQLDIHDSASPIHLASGSGNLSMCDMLLRAGANVNEKDETGRTPLHLAAENDHGEVCKVLVQNGAIVDETDDGGWTALQLTLYFCQDQRHGPVYFRENTLDICEALLSAGADILLQEGQSRSAFELSASFQDESLIDRFLIVWDSRFNGRNDEGDLPLHVAVTNSGISLPVLGALLRHNSKALSAPDGESGWLPLHLACMWDADLDVVFSIVRDFPGAVDPKVVSELMKLASE